MRKKHKPLAIASTGKVWRYIYEHSKLKQEEYILVFYLENTPGTLIEEIEKRISKQGKSFNCMPELARAWVDIATKGTERKFPRRTIH